MAISFNACCMALMSAIVWLCASLSFCKSIISNAATYNTRLINNSQNIMNNQSSIDILVMFIISTLHDSRDQSKQQYAIGGFNQTSDMTNQVELQQTR